MTDVDTSASVEDADGGYTSLFVTATDGKRLHVRSYGPTIGTGMPVVCLPGLARTSADFHPLALALANDVAEPRRVVALDYRGRGRSEYDSPSRYTTHVELEDVSAVLTALGLLPALFVGTSRGGILAMMLAASRPTIVTGVVLNDIGPVIEAKGLMRIRNYVGKLPVPRSYEEGAEILRKLFNAQFPKLDARDWVASARRTWKESNGGLVPDYDVNLARTLDAIDLERPLPSMWGEFEALARVPLMVIRGANSDLLSSSTLDAMRSRRLDLDVVEVPDQGHAPLLVEPDVIRRIAAFLTFCDISARH